MYNAGCVDCSQENKDKYCDVSIDFNHNHDFIIIIFSHLHAVTLDSTPWVHVSVVMSVLELIKMLVEDLGTHQVCCYCPVQKVSS